MDMAKDNFPHPNPPPQAGEGIKLWWWIATWFGCGLSPIVSGTVGSLGALPFAYFIQTSFGNFGLFSASIIIFAVGIWASSEYLRHHPEKQDPGQIVVDEVAGQWLLLSVLLPTWQAYLLGFILFRVFDILKPWPVSLADEKIHGGLGVMMDDMLAAFYPILMYMVLMVFFPHLVSQFLNLIGGSYVH